MESQWERNGVGKVKSVSGREVGFRKVGVTKEEK